MRKRFLSILSNLGISACAILLTLFLLEVFFRLFLPQSEFGIVLSPWGFAHKPNAKIHYRWRNQKIPVSYNSKGLRGPEYSYEKPPGVFRVLVLGDSWVEDMGSFEESLFTTRLEKMLNRLYPKPRFEVINAGQYGFDHVQELMFYLKEGRKYRPDLVVVIYAMDSADLRLAQLEDGRLRLRYMTFSRSRYLLRALITWVRMYSHFGSFLLTRIQAMPLGAVFSRYFYGRYPEGSGNGGPKSPAIPLAVFPPDHPNVANLSEKVQEELKRKEVIQSEGGFRTAIDWHVWSRFKKETEKDGSRLVIFQVWPDTVFRFREKFPPLDILAFNMSRVPGDAGVRLRKAIAEGTYDPFLGSHRWGYQGNEIAAQDILKSLTEAGLLPPRPQG